MCSFSFECDTPAGKILLASDGEFLTAARLQGREHPGEFQDNNILATCRPPVLLRAKNWLEAYFAGEKPQPGELPLKPEGSEFRQEVWRLLLDIPYGKCVTYGFMAREIAMRRGLERMSAQAVGGAIGHNPIAIIIPCHRVIGHNGNLTGYGGGLDIKIQLLRHEGIDVSRLAMPKTRNGSRKARGQAR